MKFTLKSFIGAAAVASIAFAGTASADPLKCHSTIGKNIAKYQATLAKNLVGCHKARNAGKIGAATLCNTTAGADTKGKASAAKSKALAAITSTCLSPADDAVLALYSRCPSPVNDADGPDGITTFAEVGACLTALSEAYINRIGEQVQGYPAAGTLPLSKPKSACTGAIGKTVSKAIKTAGKTRTKCQSLLEKTAAGVLDYDTCADANPGDSSGKISGAMAAIDTAISTSCSDALVSKADKASLGLCGHNVADLQDCVRDRVVEPTANGLAAATQELEGNCASFARVNINAAFGEKLSETVLDAGFSGLGHGVDVIDESVGSVELSGCDADCENCAVTNDPTPGQCRCSNNVTIQCDAGVEVADLDDCGGAICNCFFGPPLPLNSGGTPVCVQNKFAKEFTGGTQAVGEYDVGTRTRAIVHTGVGQLQPCPSCSGASVGVAGTCSGGARNGLGCTTNAIHPDFGATSFDCPPNSNVSGAGLNLGLQFTSGTVSFTAAINNASHCNGGTCHCSQCSGDAAVGCASDADCDAAAIADGGMAGDKGTCGSNLGADNPKPNGCTGATPTCEPDGSGMGTCDFDGMNTGPVDSFCSGAVRQNGEGILPCGMDADCAALNPICPGSDCGTCSVSAARSCFLPLITTTGTPGIFNSDGVSAFCSARTSNPGVNAAGGLPGPGKVKLDFDFDIKCSDNTTTYQLPDGANCP